MVANCSSVSIGGRFRRLPKVLKCMKIGVSFSAFSRKKIWEKMGVWVAFLKQPALLGEAPQTKKIKKSKNHK
jgi:hypothetical protein